MGGADRRARSCTGVRVVAAAWLAAAASCSFPEYEFSPNGAGGNATQAGAAGNGGSAAGGKGGASSSAGASGEPAGGAAGEAGAPGSACGPSVPARPGTCYDGVLSGAESDVDCGGGECQPCFEGACAVDGDCATGACVGLACVPRFRLAYQADQQMRITTNLSFRVNLTYESGPSPVPLESLAIRYYFARNGVAEPITVGNPTCALTQSSVSSDIKTDTAWKLVKINAAADAQFDIYLEVGFTGPQSLVAGDSVLLTQEINIGNIAHSFDQETHYSYEPVSLQDWDHITVYQNEKLVWGLEPRGGGKPSCFVRGVNLNGPALTIDGESWESAESAGLPSNGSAFMQTVAIYPDASGDLLGMLQTGYTLSNGQGVHLPLENGEYLVYAYGFSANAYGLSTLTVEGDAFDDFQMSWLYGIQSWSKLGPYPVQVSDGMLDLESQGGDLSLSGIEIRTPGDASY